MIAGLFAFGSGTDELKGKVKLVDMTGPGIAWAELTCAWLWVGKCGPGLSIVGALVGAADEADADARLKPLG